MPKPRTNSELIEAAAAKAIAAVKNDHPSDTQIREVVADLEMMKALANAGAESAAAVGKAARAGSPVAIAIVTLFSTAVLAVGISLGIPALASNDDAAQAKVAVDAMLPRVTELEDRQRDEERRARRIDALTVRWLGDTWAKNCEAMQVIVSAISASMPKPKKGESAPVQPTIDCEAATLPPELVRLVADLDIQESRISP